MQQLTVQQIADRLIVSPVDERSKLQDYIQPLTTQDLKIGLLVYVECACVPFWGRIDNIEETDWVGVYPGYRYRVAGIKKIKDGWEAIWNV